MVHNNLQAYILFFNDVTLLQQLYTSNVAAEIVADRRRFCHVVYVGNRGNWFKKTQNYT